MITPDPKRLQPCGYCRRCAVHDDPGGCLEVEKYQRWLDQKAEGEAVAELLGALPIGTEFTLAGAGRAYSATYRKNAEGLWDQVWAVERPYVLNMDAAHLGFCVGREAIAGAVSRTAVA